MAVTDVREAKISPNMCGKTQHIFRTEMLRI